MSCTENISTLVSAITSKDNSPKLLEVEIIDLHCKLDLDQYFFVLGSDNIRVHSTAVCSEYKKKYDSE